MLRSTRDFESYRALREVWKVCDELRKGVLQEVLQSRRRLSRIPRAERAFFYFPMEEVNCGRWMLHPTRRFLNWRCLSSQNIITRQCLTLTSASAWRISSLCRECLASSSSLVICFTRAFRPDSACLACSKLPSRNFTCDRAGMIYRARKKRTGSQPMLRREESRFGEKEEARSVRQCTQHVH